MLEIRTVGKAEQKRERDIRNREDKAELESNKKIRRPPFLVHRSLLQRGRGD
jgi:hypothetical protein